MRFERVPWWSAVVFAALAFLHAALWGSIVPPWQIPDEAAHFEYVYLLTRLGRRPTPADADPELQAAILRSMWENRYWEYLGFRRPEQPPRRILAGAWTVGGALSDDGVVGDAYIYAFSQLPNPTPAYYALLAPVQRLVMDLPVADQLFALRWASRVIFALGVMFIVLTAGEVFAWRAGPVLGSGLFSVLQPMFVYIGSGLNNDNGVMLFASAATWQLARGWRRSYPWWRPLLIAALVVLAVQAKRTGVFLVAWAPLVMVAWGLLRMERRRARRLVAAGAMATGAVGLLAVALYFIPGPTPANWRSSAPWQPTWSTVEARAGSRSFLLQNVQLTTSFRRPFGLADGSEVVVEAWVKGGPGAQGSLSVSEDSGNMASAPFGEAMDWQPVSVTLRLSSNASRLSVTLIGSTSAPIYVDDVRAFIQTTQTIALPAPNPSAEAALPLLGQIILEASRPLGVYGQAVRVVQDYRANLAALGERLPQAIAFVQQSYWGKFGIFARAQTPTLHMGWVTVLALWVGVALGGAIGLIARRQPDPATAALMGLWLAGGALLIVQTLAPLLSFSAEGLWLPQGRYLFGGMALIAPALVWGGMGGMRGRRHLWAAVAIILFLLALNASLFSQCGQYFGRVALIGLRNGFALERLLYEHEVLHEDFSLFLLVFGGCCRLCLVGMRQRRIHFANKQPAEIGPRNAAGCCGYSDAG